MATVEYSLPAPDDVQIELYDLLGRRLATVEDRFQVAGEHKLQWKTMGLSRGMYFYRLRVGQTTVTRSMLVLK